MALEQLAQLRADVNAERAERRAGDERHAQELAAERAARLDLERRLAEADAARADRGRAVLERLDALEANPPSSSSARSNPPAADVHRASAAIATDAAWTPRLVPAATGPAGPTDLDRLLAAVEPFLAGAPEQIREAVRESAEVLTDGFDAQALAFDERLGVLAHVARLLLGDAGKRPERPGRYTWSLALGPAEKRLTASQRDAALRWLRAGPPRAEPSAAERRSEAEARRRAVEAEAAERARADREAATRGEPSPFEAKFAAMRAAARVTVPDDEGPTPEQFARMRGEGGSGLAPPPAGRLDLQRQGHPVTAELGAPRPPGARGGLERVDVGPAVRLLPGAPALAQA